MEVREIGRGEIWVEGGYVMGSTVRGESRTRARVVDGERRFRGAVNTLEGMQVRTDVRVDDTSMTYTEAGKYDFVTPMLLVRGGPRYGGRFDVRESVSGGLLLPEGEPGGGYVFSDEDCGLF